MPNITLLRVAKGKKEEHYLFYIYLTIGAISGFIAGLLGIGGGIIVVPALAAVFIYTGMQDAYVMHMAIGTSLASMIFTLLSALKLQHRRGNVRWDLVKVLLPGLVIGSVAGAAIASSLPSRYLVYLFSIFLCIISARLWFSKKEGQHKDSPISPKIMRLFAGLIGALSSILGAGGGSMLIPFMLHCGVNFRQAMGTSVACGIGVAAIATLCFMLFGGAVMNVKWSTGYIYWPAFLGITMASMLFAPLGVQLAHKLPTSILKRVLAIFLFLIAIDMFFTHQG